MLTFSVTHVYRDSDGSTYLIPSTHWNIVKQIEEPLPITYAIGNHDIGSGTFGQNTLAFKVIKKNEADEAIEADNTIKIDTRYFIKAKRYFVDLNLNTYFLPDPEETPSSEIPLNSNSSIKTLKHCGVIKTTVNTDVFSAITDIQSASETQTIMDEACFTSLTSKQTYLVQGGSSLFLLSEYFEGEPLKKFLAENELTFEERVELVRDALMQLNIFKKFTHLDISENNVLVAKNKRLLGDIYLLHLDDNDESLPDFETSKMDKIARLIKWGDEIWLYDIKDDGSFAYIQLDEKMIGDIKFPDSSENIVRMNNNKISRELANEIIAKNPAHKFRTYFDVSIIDFGSAALIGKDADPNQLYVVEPQGTPAFMAPEVAQGAACLKSAEYSFAGAILYKVFGIKDALKNKLIAPFDRTNPSTFIELTNQPYNFTGLPPDLTLPLFSLKNGELFDISPYLELILAQAGDQEIENRPDFDKLLSFFVTLDNLCRLNKETKTENLYNLQNKYLSLLIIQAYGLDTTKIDTMDEDTFSTNFAAVVYLGRFKKLELIDVENIFTASNTWRKNAQEILESKDLDCKKKADLLYDLLNIENSATKFLEQHDYEKEADVERSFINYAKYILFKHHKDLSAEFTAHLNFTCAISILALHENGKLNKDTLDSLVISKDPTAIAIFETYFLALSNAKSIILWDIMHKDLTATTKILNLDILRGLNLLDEELFNIFIKNPKLISDIIILLHQHKRYCVNAINALIILDNYNFLDEEFLQQIIKLAAGDPNKLAEIATTQMTNIVNFARVNLFQYLTRDLFNILIKFNQYTGEYLDNFFNAIKFLGENNLLKPNICQALIQNQITNPRLVVELHNSNNLQYFDEKSLLAILSLSEVNFNKLTSENHLDSFIKAIGLLAQNKLLNEAMCKTLAENPVNIAEAIEILHNANLLNEHSCKMLITSQKGDQSNSFAFKIIRSKSSLASLQLCYINGIRIILKDKDLFNATIMAWSIDKRINYKALLELTRTQNLEMYKLLYDCLLTTCETSLKNFNDEFKKCSRWEKFLNRLSGKDNQYDVIDMTLKALKEVAGNVMSSTTAPQRVANSSTYFKCMGPEELKYLRDNLPGMENLAPIANEIIGNDPLPKNNFIDKPRCG